MDGGFVKKRFRSHSSCHFQGEPRYFAERSQRVSPCTTLWTRPSGYAAAPVGGGGLSCANPPAGSDRVTQRIVKAVKTDVRPLIVFTSRRAWLSGLIIPNLY